jgi:putative phosphoesterase
MRILLVSDLHSNWPALQALSEPHDLCICLGDIVDYGPAPAPCVEWVRNSCQLAVRGNHDHGAAQNVVTQGQTGFRYLTGVTRALTRRRLGREHLRFLASLPTWCRATLDGLTFLLVHATPRDPLDEFAPAAAEFWSRRLDGVEADVVCVGHTHNPYVLEVDGKLIVNPGSIGLPRDGDPRPGYAVMEHGQVELKRYDYPIEETVRQVEQSDLPDQAKELLTQVYRTGTLRRNGTQDNTSPLAPRGRGVGGEG